MHDFEARPQPYATYALLAGQIVVALGAGLSVALQRTAIASCFNRNCNYDLMFMAGNVYFAVASALVIVCIAVTITLTVVNRTRPRNHKIWLAWVPITGIALTLIAWGIAATMFQTGLHPAR